MKPREFWISGINFDEYKLNQGDVVTGFITIENPGKKEAIHVREVVPSSTEVKPKIDWEKVWSTLETRTGVWLGERTEEDLKELVEKQLKGEE